MTEGAARWSPVQQSMLRELGCEMFALRGARDSSRHSREGGNPGAATSATASEAAPNRASSQRPAPGLPPARERRSDAARERRVLVVLSPEANWLRGPHAKLARGLLAALGVHEDDVRGEPHGNAPALCFGRETPGATHAPALATLRTAQAKRALWPALRALRRRLRDGLRG